MFRFLRPARRQPHRKRPTRSLLSVEALETRNCPVIAQGNPYLTLAVAPADGQEAVLSGTVTDADPASCTIAFSGVASGSVQADSSGNFSCTVPASSLGTITAQAQDGQGLSSNQVQAVLSCDAPTVNLTATGNPDGTMTLAGQVSDESPDACTVALSGAVVASVTPDASGDFSYTTADWALGSVSAQATDAWGQASDSYYATLTGTAPIITSFNVQAAGDGQVLLSGTVSDKQPESCVLTFGNEVSGQAQADSSGAFSLLTTAWGLGTITAQAEDGQGLNSDPAMADFAVAPPSLNLSTTYGADGSVTLWGQVTADQPSGLTVTFGGGVQGSTTTDAYGNFSYTTADWNLGTFTAQVTDAWGQASDSYYATLTGTAPIITSFNVQAAGDGQVLLSGTVSDKQPESCVLTFGNEVSGQAQADSSGAFSLLTTAWGLGTITAQAEDGQGLDSDPAMANFAVAPPSLTLDTTLGGDGSVTVWGQVTADQPGGLTVTIGGGVQGSATTDAYGNFSYTTADWEPGSVSAQTTDGWGQASDSYSITLKGTAPVISNFSVQAVGDGQVLLSGTVSDKQPDSCIIAFGNEVSGQVQADGSGAFSLLTTAWGLGTITAQAEDGQGLDSDPAMADFTVPPPSLNLNATYGANGSVTVWGQVTGGQPGSQMVLFGGGVQGSATTDDNGNFSFTAPSGQWTAGNVTAQVTDPWGQASNTASATLVDAPPVINNFTAVEGASGLWTFHGQVVDEYAPGETVRLSGLPTLNGSQGYTTVTVGSDGCFCYTVQLGPDDTGTVCAMVIDWSGQQSNTVTANV